jgi:L-iditol 2-dehydrogenase
VKAALVRAPGEVEVVEMEPPRLSAGEIRVAMKAVGLCGSDVTRWYVATKAPAVLGHETAGVVESVAPDVAAFVPGDRVFVHHHAPCGACAVCRRGDSVMCAEWKPTRLHPGGLAELVRVEAATVERDTLKLPDALGFEDGTLVEPLACALKAVRRGDVRPGDTALVIGLGSNGLLLALAARSAGAAVVIGSDPDPARRGFAERHGLDVLVDPSREDLVAAVRARTEGRGADAVFVVPTAPEVVSAALAAAAPGGRVVFYSPIEPGKVWPIVPSEPYFKDLTLRFSYSCGPAETREALRLIERGVVRAETLVTHRLPLARAAEAYRLAEKGGEVLKVVVTV